MTFKNILIIGTSLLILIMVVQVSQFLMLRVFSMGLQVTENITTPLALVLSFVVGYFLSNRSED
jgi:accessory gene regulator protein AgrB